MSIRPVPSRLVLAAAGVVLVAGLAACSSSGDDNASSSSSNSAVAGSPSTVAAAFDRVAGAVGDAKSVSGTIEATTQIGAVDGTFAVKYTDAGVLSSFEFSQDGKAVKGVIAPDAIYVGGSALPLPSGKSYLKIAASDSNPLIDGFRSFADEFAKAGDVEASVAEWKGLADLKEAGTENVGGVTATKYTGTIDPKNPPAGASESAKTAYAAAAARGVTSIKTTVWIGPDGLPLKVETTSVGGDAPGSATLTYKNWGGAVDVQVPSAGQVADLSTVLGG